ncbi:hypothetical protein L3X38_016208 [Prunus dulcis]|uniref:Uncharacterized protein n=1 Tax=Prunus dulcis TaxID=3755 RepID=A0AAD4Z8Z0_PRUDU|nr:hypothetical protein L3X38_016208 [Prunus dulcis]
MHVNEETPPLKRRRSAISRPSRPSAFPESKATTKASRLCKSYSKRVGSVRTNSSLAFAFIYRTVHTRHPHRYNKQTKLSLSLSLSELCTL